jgi:hypothetical protein
LFGDSDSDEEEASKANMEDVNMNGEDMRRLEEMYKRQMSKTKNRIF